MARTWNEERAGQRISSKIAGLPTKDIVIRDYVRETNLEDLPAGVAYRVNGVHLYADILNLSKMLNVTDYEGEMCHRRTLRFLNLHYRAVYRILERTKCLLVDFHNQRLHTVLPKPYDSEAARVHKAIAVAQLIIDVLARTGEDADHPAAEVRVGIDTGKALAVSNGRRGHREPLFLGCPANHAAKRAGGGDRPGIYLTNEARVAVGLAKVPSEDATTLSKEEIKVSQGKAALDVTADQIVKLWEKDKEDHPLDKFGFSGHTPPYRNLDIEALSVANSRRQDAASVYADLDGFTQYVADNLAKDDSAKKVVQVLHVLRSELDAVLHEDFSGRKVRFVGDCVHGLLVEGTSQTTDPEETISNLTLCAGAMRSSFNLAIKKLKTAGSDASNLGLSIGFEYGPINVTRLGIKGELIRCSASRAVLKSEAEQARCSGTETAIGAEAYLRGSSAVRDFFGTGRKRADVSYAVCVDELSKKNDKAARATKLAESSLLQPAAAAASFTFPSERVVPKKPAGYA